MICTGIMIRNELLWLLLWNCSVFRNAAQMTQRYKFDWNGNAISVSLSDTDEIQHDRNCHSICDLGIAVGMISSSQYL